MLTRTRGPDAYEQTCVMPLIARYGGYCWPLRDAVGAASVRELRGLNAGTPSGSGLTFQSAGMTVSGRLSPCCAFDGSNGVITCSTPVDPSGAFSVAFFASVTSVSDGTSRYPFAVAVSGTSRFAIRYLSAGIKAGFNDGVTSYACSGTSAALGWQHIAASKGAGGVAPSLYVNGVLQTGTSAPSFDSTVAMTLGAFNSGAAKWNGSLSYVVVVPAALSASEISALYLGAVKGV